MACLSLTELLGARVSDPAGATGRVRELVMRPQEDTTRISALLVKTKDGDRLLPFADVTTINGGIRTSRPISQWVSSLETEGLLASQAILAQLTSIKTITAKILYKDITLATVVGKRGEKGVTSTYHESLQ